MALYGYKRKGKDALWKSAFPKQVAQVPRKLPPKAQKTPLRAPRRDIPRQARVRQVSKAQGRLNAKYYPLATAYKIAHPFCECCELRGRKPNPTEDLHHKKGRGKYLLATEFFCAVCRDCHTYIDANRTWAYDVGMLIRRDNALPTPSVPAIVKQDEFQSSNPGRSADEGS